MNNRPHWNLNDQVIDDYFKLIQDRDPRVYCFKTLIPEWHIKDGHKGVERWTTNVNIFMKSKLFFPIQIRIGQFSHWVLVCADVIRKQITYYDSVLMDDNYGCLSIVYEHLDHEHKAKFGKPLKIAEWNLVIGVNPRQADDIGCGAFICTLAEYISRDARFNFDGRHMMSFRLLIAHELKNKKLIDINEDETNIDERISGIINNI